uniref:Peptidase S10 serine carboxypeptidase n=1 Tax=Caulobacter sp. (strain K31) TaxID=366602 RepID=B0T929_CAUSK
MNRSDLFALDRRALMLAGLCAAATGRAQARQAEDPGGFADVASLSSTVTGEGVFGGAPVSYSASVAATQIPNPAGGAPGAMVSIAYVRTDVADAARRPVLFLFNGGPGASTTPLHFSGLGPFTRFTPPGDDKAQLAPNRLCPLDYVDLVFVDPIGTGFSRPTDRASGKGFWTMDGDAESVARFIELWLKANGRERSPIYICGESYGTARAALMLRARPQNPYAGVILISPVINATAMTVTPGNDLAFVFWLPSMAAVAAYHGRAGVKGAAVSAHFLEAARFAGGDYARALFQGADLPADQARVVARRLAALTGLPAKEILAQSLRIDPDVFMRRLLADQGLRTGRLDGRVTGRLDAPPRPPPYNDPSLSPGGDSGPAIEDYFRRRLGVSTKAAYKRLALDFRDVWVMAYPESLKDGYSDVSQFLGAALRASPHCRLLVVGGYFDLATPIFAREHALSHAGAPRGQVQTRMYAAGHAVLEEPAALASFAADLKAMITETQA